MRLVSLIWELAGHSETFTGFFSAGMVKATAVHRVIPKERVQTEFVRETVSSWRASLKLGQNYRNACAVIGAFRGSFVEHELRAACRLLSRWSLMEVLTVAFEKSPMFLQNEYQLVDAALFALPDGARCGNTTVRRVLEHALPVLFEVRSEARISPLVATGELAEFLLSIPSVRQWGRDTQELVLTHEQVAENAGGETVGRLRSMSANRSIVHFGRLPTKLRGDYGTKKVYLFNGSDLKRVLAGVAVPF